MYWLGSHVTLCKQHLSIDRYELVVISVYVIQSMYFDNIKYQYYKVFPVNQILHSNQRNKFLENE